ncbi:DUF7927 domain-containing protein [Nocardioides sambongensis]|uniref:DUF7927 domain-containing protein n=1 Tax=Nocardioides sambongensis TaxID=2589074 RepID=UPI0015E86CF3|nr:DUF11 domain-containing protein [Nocardioides sambongensis]
MSGAVPELSIDKVAPDLDGVQVGDSVDYAITVTNVGAGDYSADNPAVMVDDLSDVLDDATYGGDAAADPAVGSLQYADGTLVWSGPLAAGASVTVSYSVTVTGAGDDQLTNTAYQPRVASAPPPRARNHRSASTVSTRTACPATRSAVACRR